MKTYSRGSMHRALQSLLSMGKGGSTKKEDGCVMCARETGKIEVCRYEDRKQLNVHTENDRTTY